MVRPLHTQKQNVNREGNETQKPHREKLRSLWRVEQRASVSLNPPGATPSVPPRCDCPGLSWSTDKTVSITCSNRKVISTSRAINPGAGNNSVFTQSQENKCAAARRGMMAHAEILALGRLTKEDQVFKAKLGNTESRDLKYTQENGSG